MSDILDREKVRRLVNDIAIHFAGSGCQADFRAAYQAVYRRLYLNTGYYPAKGGPCPSRLGNVMSDGFMPQALQAAKEEWEYSRAEFQRRAAVANAPLQDWVRKLAGQAREINEEAPNKQPLQGECVMTTSAIERMYTMYAPGERQQFTDLSAAVDSFAAQVKQRDDVHAVHASAILKNGNEIGLRTWEPVEQLA